MPPLLLDEEQAVATALALQTAPTIVAGVGDAAARALTTLRGALSPQLRAEVDNVRITAVPNAWEFRAPPIAADVLKAVGSAVRKGHLLRFDVLSADGRRPAPGESDFRPPMRVEPHDLVVWAGRWYVVAFELDAGQWVVHRIDRLHPYGPTGAPFVRRDTPYDDAGRYVRGRPDRGDTPAGWQCTGSAVVELPAAVVARWAPGGSVVEPVDASRCRITLSAWSWAGIGGLLATFDAPLSCVEPDELREAMQVVLQRFTGCVPRQHGRTSDSPQVP